MPFSQEKLASARQSSIDTLHSYSSSLLTGSARVVALNVETAQRLLTDGTSYIKALFGARDLNEAQALQSSLAQPGFDKSVSYLRSIHEISSELQGQLHRIFTAQFGEFQKHTDELIDRTARHAPAGSDVAIAGVRSAFKAANSAFGSLGNVARQVSDIAEANISAVGNATARAVAPAAAGKKKSA